MNFCIVSGSARTNNNTIRLAKAIEKLVTQLGFSASVIDFEQYDIPLINQGEIDRENPTSFQKSLIENMQRAEVILIISPEYNWSTTPEILNWLHRFGETKFIDLFQNKVFATLGVSTGKGGKAPVLHLNGILNKIISFMELESIVSPRIFESHFTKEVLDENGNIQGNEQFTIGLNKFIAYTIQIANRWFK